MATYRVDLQELVKAFPRPAGASALPPLLNGFGRWMSGKPWRSIGAFDLAVRWSDAHFAGAEFHHDQFALFIGLPDGSSAGYWLDDRPLSHAPIVLLGGGGFVILAPDLETLLARIALGRFRSKGPEADFLYSEEDYGEGVVPDLRGPMQAFLREQTGIQELESLVRKAAPYPSHFAAWVEQSAATYRAQMRTHPAILAMASILGGFRPLSAQPWECATINVTWVGPHFDAWAAPDRQKALAEAERLKPHLAALRDEAAARLPGLGLWHRATLMVYKDSLELKADYLFEPDFRSGKPSAEAFKADQVRAPRAARRVPPWLAPILASS